MSRFSRAWGLCLLAIAGCSGSTCGEHDLRPSATGLVREPAPTGAVPHMPVPLNARAPYYGSLLRLPNEALFWPTSQEPP